MAEWRIEQASRAATCLGCFKAIPRDAWRFGTPAKTRWFHLHCAAEGAPKVFPPFAAQAEVLLAKGAAPKPGGARELTRRELESLLQVPGDDALDVLCDALQEQGDPWGELIRLRIEGDDDAANTHFRRHVKSLLGGIGAGEVMWRNGVMVDAYFTGKTAHLAERLERLGALRTAGRLEYLQLEGVVDGAVFALISKVAPTLQRLTLVGHASGFEKLALPRLETLSLGVPSLASLKVKAGPAPQLEGLLTAKLPSLKNLRLTTHRPVPLTFLDSLLASTLLRGLEWLDFDDASTLMRTLDDEGLRRLLASKAALAHLDSMWVERSGRALTAAEAKTAESFFEKRGARALARLNDDEWIYDDE